MVSTFTPQMDPVINFQFGLGAGAQLPHRAAGKANDLLGLSLALTGYPDDVQLYAGGRCQAAAAVQALSESVHIQPRKRRFLQRTVQEPV